MSRSMKIVCVISVLHVLIYPGSFSFKLYTERFLTAVRGKEISLPCTFTVSTFAVYWYKHAYTGAPDENTTLVAREFQGLAGPAPGIERFDITEDYNLVIRNISFLDETTYSCVVFPRHQTKKRSYTDLRVIALAEPLEPVIESCKVTAPRRCSFTIYDDLPEQVYLDCKIYNVRPPPNLTWTDSHGRLLEIADPQINEADGLFEVSSSLQVLVDSGDDQYFCQAEGKAVNGTSSMKVEFNVDANTGSHHGWIIGVIISILILVTMVLMIMLVIMVKRNQRDLRTQADKKANCASTPLSSDCDEVHCSPKVIAESPNTRSGSVQVSEGIETNKSSGHGENPDSENGSLISFSESAQEPEDATQVHRHSQHEGNDVLLGPEDMEANNLSYLIEESNREDENFTAVSFELPPGPEDMEANNLSYLIEEANREDENFIAVSFEPPLEPEEDSSPQTQLTPIKGDALCLNPNLYGNTISDKEILKLSEMLPPKVYPELNHILGFDYQFYQRTRYKYADEGSSAFRELLHAWRNKGGLMKKDLDDALQKIGLHELVQQYKN